jgi:hypothetical protein
LNLSQISAIAVDSIVQLLILVAVVGYSPNTSTRQFVARRRTAA